MRSFYPSVGLLLIAMISIHIGASIAKGLFPIMGPAGMTALRVLFSAILMSLASQLWKHKILRQHYPIIALYGICLGSMNLFFYFALQRIPLGIAVAIEFTGPLAVALYSSKKMIDLLWIGLAVAGLLLLLPSNTSISNLDLGGALLALLAGGFWGLYIVFGKRANLMGSSMHISALGMWFATLVVLPVGIFFNGAAMLKFSMWPLGLAVALLSSAIPYTLEMKAMTKIPSKTFSILMSLEPVMAVLIGFLLLSESLNLIQLTAIAMIIVASVGSHYAD